MSIFKSITFFALLVIVSVATISLEDVEKSKLEIISKEVAVAANAIRNITIRGPECKLQLASMANDYMAALHLAEYTLNNLIPSHVADKQLVGMGNLISNYANEMQKVLSGNPEVLKEKLVFQLEDIKKIAQSVQVEYKAPNEFVNNQLTRKHDIAIFIIYKLRSRATYFEKSNKELGSEMNANLIHFKEAIERLSSTDKTIEREMRHAMHHLSTVIERAVYKLENWMEVNPDKTEEIKIIQKISIALSGLYSQLIYAAGRQFQTSALNTKIIKILTTAVEQVVKLSQIEYTENVGGQEFIRSTLFDFIAVGKAYHENIELLFQRDV